LSLHLEQLLISLSEIKEAIVEDNDGSMIHKRIVSGTQTMIQASANEWTVGWRRERNGNGSKAPEGKTEVR
jgi:hypothetical protein